MSRRFLSPQALWLALCWLSVLEFCRRAEAQRLRAVLDAGADALVWATSFWSVESTPPTIVLLALPSLFLFVRRHQRPRTASVAGYADMPSGPYLASLRQRTASVAAVFLMSLVCSVAVGSRPVSVSNGFNAQTTAFADLPPAYHDEFSYLLQARTFLDGRLSYPPAAVRPDLFHQFHVLNEYRTASRYFPWTGMWVAPFLKLEHPVWGQWLAGALSAAFFYLSAAQLVRQRAALAGGLLIAASPGLAVFSNLILAHHPTMLALSIFLWAFLRMLQGGGWRFSLIAGTALMLAMLGRPMTAAGFALPFGLLFAWRMLARSSKSDAATSDSLRPFPKDDRADAEIRRSASAMNLPVLAAGLAVPLLLGFAILALFNHSITGSWLKSAYQQYTDTFTPSHRYGFNNAAAAVESTVDTVRPKAVVEYDRWATNLTPAGAVVNVRHRIASSAQWSLGIVPVLFGLLMTLPPLLFGSPSRDASDAAETAQTDGGLVVSRTGIRLLACSVISLHLVHIPYWFDGIMHWHYVFETAPLLLLLTGIGLTYAVDILKRQLPPKPAIAWMLCFIASALLPDWVSVPEVWGTSKVDAAVSELAYSRIRMKQFQNVVGDDAVAKPALILVDETGTDFQLSYIVNPPDYSGPVLVCRMPESPEEIDDLQAAFADRRVYVFDPVAFSLTEVPARSSP
ncbi:MAG: glycosyltransferase family 39 protein [Planctomycetaceae bacterium]